VKAAIELQEAFRARNLAYPPNRWLQFRLGLASGKVVDRDGDLLGMAVNVAARLEKLAKPGGICMSGAIYEAVAGALPVPFVDLGERLLKNIPFPVRAYAIAWPGAEVEPEPPPAVSLIRRKIVLWAAATCVAALAIVGGVAAGLWLVAPAAQLQASAERPVAAQRAAETLSLPADPAATFAQLSQRGGLIEDPQSAPGLYYKALLFEAKGETSGAHRAYYALARMGLEYVDPHLRYAALVRTHEGRIVTRQVYAELHEDAPSRATALLYALQCDGAERRDRIQAIVDEHPDFAPAYYFLAEEHSEDTIGNRQSLKDKQIELAALTEFLKADRDGKLARFFLDQAVLSDWLKRARERQTKLASLLSSASALPDAGSERE